MNNLKKNIKRVRDILFTQKLKLEAELDIIIGMRETTERALVDCVLSMKTD